MRCAREVWGEMCVKHKGEGMKVGRPADRDAGLIPVEGQGRKIGWQVSSCCAALRGSFQASGETSGKGCLLEGSHDEQPWTGPSIWYV